jgi:hypothetical protein
MSDRRPDPRLIASADIVFSSTMRGDSLRFAIVPESSVTFDGEPGEDSGSGSSRTRLPDQATEGTVYRTFRIDYVIAARVVTSPPPDHEESVHQDQKPR